MSANLNPITPRREFVRRAARRLALGLIATGTVYVASTRRPPTDHGSCQHLRPCDGCTRLPGCDLPEARLHRETHPEDRSHE